MLTKSKNQFDKFVKFGVIDYLTFNEAVLVKICSMYLNKSLILPHNAIFTINQQHDLDNIKPILLKHGSNVEKINLSHIVSTTQNIDLISDLCQNLHILEIACVNITKSCHTAIVCHYEKILTEQYLDSKHFEKLQKLIVYDSFVDNDALERPYIIEKKTTQSVCSDCGQLFFNRNMYGIFWYESSTPTNHRCENCSRLYTLRCCYGCWYCHPEMINIQKSTITHVKSTFKRYTNFTSAYVQNEKYTYDRKTQNDNLQKALFGETHNKKIYYPETIRKKYQAIKSIKTYAKPTQKQNYCRRS